jgi:hypothetical protein
VHNNPEEVRQKALRMGANMLQFVFNGSKRIFVLHKFTEKLAFTKHTIPDYGSGLG